MRRTSRLYRTNLIKSESLRLQRNILVANQMQSRVQKTFYKNSIANQSNN